MIQSMGGAINAPPSSLSAFEATKPAASPPASQSSFYSSNESMSVVETTSLLPSGDTMSTNQQVSPE